MDDGRYAVEVLESLEPAIAALNVNEKTKKSIRRSLSEANRLSLEERLARALSNKPNWLLQLGEGAVKIRASVCKRRNELSHGSPSGAVRDRQSAMDAQIDGHFIYLYCLSELFQRCGIDEKEIGDLTSKSEDVSTLLWLARKLGRSPSGRLPLGDHPPALAVAILKLATVSQSVFLLIVLGVAGHHLTDKAHMRGSNFGVRIDEELSPFSAARQKLLLVQDRSSFLSMICLGNDIAIRGGARL